MSQKHKLVFNPLTGQFDKVINEDVIPDSDILKEKYETWLSQGNSGTLEQYLEAITPHKWKSIKW